MHYVDKKGVVHYFQWRVLFLGLSDAVRLFTKVLKPICFVMEFAIICI